MFTVVQRECSSVWKMSGPFATDYDSTAKRPVVSGRQSSDPSGYWVHTRGCEASLWFCAHYLLHKCCHLLWSKERCAHVFAFPSQWTHLAFAADHPIGRSWLSKITFSGLIICCQLPVQITALCSDGPRAARKMAWWANAHHTSVVTESIESSKSHSCMASSSNW